MKRKNTKKDFNKFTKINTHKRRSKIKALGEMKKALDQIDVSYDGILLRDREDLGIGGRVSSKRGKKEIRAQGFFAGSKGGYGFVTLDEGYDKDIFIPEDKTLGAMHGDRVEIIYRIYKNYLGEEKTEGRVVKVLSYGLETLVGTVMCESSYMRGRHRVPQVWYLLADDPKISVRPRLRDILFAKEGDKAVVKLDRKGNHNYPQGDVVAVLGDTLSREANYEAILIESGIPTEFSTEELEQARRSAIEGLSDGGRVRFSNHKILTIDGEGAKDLDDAVGVRKLPNGWKLYVHIADVSAYVREKTPLDRAVMARGTSVYFTDKVVPMLPPALSNQACSLNPNEEKYTLSAVITLDSNGEIIKTEIKPSIIKSSVRGVYSEVNAIFSSTADKDVKAKYKDVIPSLLRMRELYLILAKKARKRGALNLETSEAEVILDEHGRPVDIRRTERADAEKMIEQFMLTANEGVATLLTERGIPCVYRVHNDPPADKLAEFIAYAHNLGFDASCISADKVEPSDFADLLEKAVERGLGAQVSYTMLRSMSKAEYSETLSRHFGLGISRYCHFTSPIRRLSDLATHRIIHKVLIEGKSPAAYVSYAKRAARAATDTELRAVSAERRIENLYKVIYMSDKLGEVFDGVVNSVTSFGMFVELENTCEGLIPISEMPGFFIFDEKNLSIRCGVEMYHLGDVVRVRLEEADVIRGKLRFSLVKNN